MESLGQHQIAYSDFGTFNIQFEGEIDPAPAGVPFELFDAATDQHHSSMAGGFCKYSSEQLPV
jgi:hypothetical protein